MQNQLFIIDQPLPGLDRVQTAKLVSFFSDQTCGENCWKAKEDVCRCECGGKNHGIHLRGGEGVRACKINGRRFELVAVGKHNELFSQAQELIRKADIDSGKAWYDETGELMTESNYCGEKRIVKYRKPARLDGLGPYELKYASLPQCLKWDELKYFGIADDRDRYHANAAILWKREDVPTYL